MRAQLERLHGEQSVNEGGLLLANERARVIEEDNAGNSALRRRLLRPHLLCLSARQKLESELQQLRDANDRCTQLQAEKIETHAALSMVRWLPSSLLKP